MSSRAIAITAAGIVLSQPTIPTSASKQWPRATSSMESAMTSRDTSEVRIPGEPMVIPSEIAIVLISMGVPPDARTPSFMEFASVRWPKLHGMVSVQPCATPTNGFASAAAS
jgi:hypothetical protein